MMMLALQTLAYTSESPSERPVESFAKQNDVHIVGFEVEGPHGTFYWHQ